MASANIQAHNLLARFQWSNSSDDMGNHTNNANNSGDGKLPAVPVLQDVAAAAQRLFSISGGGGGGISVHVLGEARHSSFLSTPYWCCCWCCTTTTFCSCSCCSWSSLCCWGTSSYTKLYWSIINYSDISNWFITGKYYFCTFSFSIDEFHHWKVVPHRFENCTIRSQWLYVPLSLNCIFIPPCGQY